MTEPPQKLPPRTRNFRFEWGNFLQGGLVLYLLALLVLAVAAPTIVPAIPLPPWFHLPITPTIGYVLAAFGVMLLLMATGLTFSGDAAAVLMLFQVPRGEKLRKPMSTVTVSGNRFMANERVKKMSPALRQTLLDLLAADNRAAAIDRYRQETKTDPRLAADVITQLREFERRGLLDDLD